MNWTHQLSASASGVLRMILLVLLSAPGAAPLRSWLAISVSSQEKLLELDRIAAIVLSRLDSLDVDILWPQEEHGSNLVSHRESSAADH